MKIKYVTETILCLGCDLSPGPPARQSSTVPNELKDQPSRNVICQQYGAMYLRQYLSPAWDNPGPTLGAKCNTSVGVCTRLLWHESTLLSLIGMPHINKTNKLPPIINGEDHNNF